MEIRKIDVGIGQLWILRSQVVWRDRQAWKDSQILDVKAVDIVGAGLRVVHERDVLKLQGIRQDVVLVPYPARVPEVAVDQLRGIGTELGFKTDTQRLA